MASNPSLFQTFPVLLGPVTVGYFTLRFSLPPSSPQAESLLGSSASEESHSVQSSCQLYPLYLLPRPHPGLNSTLVCQKCKFYALHVSRAGVQISAIQIFAVGFLLHNSWDSGQYSCLPAMVCLHNSVRSCYLHRPSQHSDFSRCHFFLASNFRALVFLKPHRQSFWLYPLLYLFNIHWIPLIQSKQWFHTSYGPHYQS